MNTVFCFQELMAEELTGEIELHLRIKVLKKTPPQWQCTVSFPWGPNGRHQIVAEEKSHYF